MRTLSPTATIVLCVAGCAGAPAGDSAAGWSVQIDGGCDVETREGSAPAVAGAMVFVGSRDGVIYAFDRASGERKWRFQTGAGIVEKPRAAVAPRGAGPAEMAGIALEQERKGAREARPLVTASPVVANGIVYTGSWDFSLYALDAATGVVRWSFDAGAPIAAGALLHEGLLIFATQGKQARIFALDATTGAQRWVLADPRANRTNEQRILRDGILYLTNWDGANYTSGSGVENAQTWAQAIDARSGGILWTTRLRDAWPSPPAVTQRLVLFMTTPRHPRGTTLPRARNDGASRSPSPRSTSTSITSAPFSTRSPAIPLVRPWEASTASTRGPARFAGASPCPAATASWQYSIAWPTSGLHCLAPPSSRTTA